MTLREFLLQNAPQAEQEKRRRQWRKEWVEAVKRLLEQMRAWLMEGGTADLLDLEALDLEKREQGLGTYRIPGLAIHFGEKSVKVVPVGRNVLAHLGPYAEPGHEKAEGRVDVTNGTDKYHLYRKLNDAGKEEWLVQHERSDLKRLDREAFEAVMTDLLS